MNQIKIVWTIFFSILAAPLLIAVADTGEGVSLYEDSGNLLRPENWREWVFIGAVLTPNDQNFGHAYLPEFKYVYLDPESFEVWKQTGEFREGAVVVKELLAIGSRENISGNGYFPGEYLGLEVAVKDGHRFENHLGGWGFFSFGEMPYAEAASPILGDGELDCSGCHANAPQDMIFTQFYPTLQATKPD